MLHRDATELFDLPEAGRLLLADPVRLAREARRGLIPSAWAGPHLGLPRPWVEAAAGIAPVDEAGIRGYWLARLAPPSPGARRPSRARDRLPAEALLGSAEAARRVFADPAALPRLDAEGTLPALRVDGEAVYDEALVDLVAREDTDEAARAAAAERRALVREWARYEYAAAPPTAPAAPPSATPAAPAAPGAWQVPDDLGPPEPPPEPPPGRRLIEADGFEVADEP